MKYILCAFLFNLILINEVSAQSEAIFRSIVFPGWGQHYNEQPLKGKIIIGAELLSIGGYYFINKQVSENYNEYSLSTNPMETANLFEEVEKYQRLRDISLTLIAGVWVYNVIDAWINYDKNKYPKYCSNKINVNIKDDIIALRYTFDLKIIGGN